MQAISITKRAYDNNNNKIQTNKPRVVVVVQSVVIPHPVHIKVMVERLADRAVRMLKSTKQTRKNEIDL